MRDVAEQDGPWYLVIDCIDGEDVAARLRRDGRLSLDPAVRWTEEIARALDAAHRHAVVHRDAEPHHGIIGRDDRVRVTDFGIARAAERNGLTTTGAPIGTPEQAASGPARAARCPGRARRRPRAAGGSSTAPKPLPCNDPGPVGATVAGMRLPATPTREICE